MKNSFFKGLSDDFIYSRNLNVYLAFSSITSFLHILAGAMLIAVETKWTSCLMGSCLLTAGIVNLVVFKKRLRESETYADFLNLFTYIDFGHVLTSILMLIPLYTENNPFKYYLTPVGILTISLMMMHLKEWYHESFSSAAGSDYLDYDRSLRAFIYKYVMGALIVITYGLAESRIQHGHILLTCFEGLFGFLTTALLFFTQKPFVRRSTQGNIALLAWTVISFIYLLVAGLYYYIKGVDRDSHIRVGFSLLIALVYFFIMLFAVILKSVVLEEPFNFTHSQKQQNLKDIPYKTDKSVLDTPRTQEYFNAV